MYIIHHSRHQDLLGLNDNINTHDQHHIINDFLKNELMALLNVSIKCTHFVLSLGLEPKRHEKRHILKKI